MFRPQFAYPTPPGCRDEEFTYFFDQNNTPWLATDLSGGAKIDNIPLKLEQDAPFYWRGIKLALLCNLEGPNLYEFPNIAVRFQDPYTNDLSDGLVPAVNSYFPMNPLNSGTAAGAGLPVRSSLLTGPPVPLEPEIYCPQGGVILFFLQNSTIVGTLSAFLNITLYGVKRFKECNP